jgi:hypothetical protein
MYSKTLLEKKTINVCKSESQKIKSEIKGLEQKLKSSNVKKNINYVEIL